MKTMPFFILAFAGLVLAGCSSTHNTTATSDSDTVVNMPETMKHDTMHVDTTMRDTTKRDTSNPGSPQ